MQWERFFEGLEGQLAAEWEAERALLDAESERARIAKLELRDRIDSFVQQGAMVSLAWTDAGTVDGRARGAGVDWVAVDGRGGELVIARIMSVESFSAAHGTLLDGLRTPPGRRMMSGMTFGFLMRDLARRRLPVRVSTVRGAQTTGTIDRAGADHLDLAQHDLDAARRIDSVTAYRVMPFDSLAWVKVAHEQGMPYVG